MLETQSYRQLQPNYLCHVGKTGEPTVAAIALEGIL